MSNVDLSRLVTAADKAEAAKAAMLSAFQAAIQAHVDDTARLRNYGDGVSLAGYVNSTVPPWAEEANAFVAWRDAVWVYAYGERDKVTAGQRPMPTIEGFRGELPAIVWPQ